MDKVRQDLSSWLHSLVKESDTARTMKWFHKSVGMTLLVSMVGLGLLFGEPSSAENDSSQEAKVEPGQKESVSEKDAEAAEEAKDKENEEEASGEERQVFGWKEWVKVGTKADVMRAKLDSGARTSSLHAENVEEFERDGRKWVRFSMKDPEDEKAKSILIKAPLQRVARVKNTDGKMERRFVVELGFAIGDRKLREEFTLNDRTGLTCPVLIGRNALRHLGFVDCSRVDLAARKVFK